MSEKPKNSVDIRINEYVRTAIAAVFTLCGFAGCTERNMQFQKDVIDAGLHKELATETVDLASEAKPEEPHLLKLVGFRAKKVIDEKTHRLILDINDGKKTSSFECPVRNSCLGEKGYITAPANTCDDDILLNSFASCVDFAKGCTEVTGDSGVGE